MEKNVLCNLASDDALKRFNSRASGLTEAEAESARKQYGPNIAATKTHSSALLLLLNQFKSPLVLLLLVAMSLSLVLGETQDAIIVLVVVLLSAGLGFWQEYRAENAVSALLSRIQTQANVLRSGEPRVIPISEVVPGDVVLLSAGDVIPADSLLLDSNDLFVDEAALTGESHPAEKLLGQLPADTPLAQRSNVLYQGTHVVSGHAKALACYTGANSEFGDLSKRLQLRPPETEFEAGIRQFGAMLIKITLVFVIAIFAVNILIQKPIVDSLLFALALSVGLTPELLPAIVSVTLANGAQRMAKQKVIVKRLAAIENFGSMNMLCSDKTGTLTIGAMQLYAAYDAAGAPDDAVKRYAFLNASYESGFANPIDKALRDLAVCDTAPYTKFDEVPYDFVRKRLSVVVVFGAAVPPPLPNMPAEPHVMITKGALQQVLAVCDSALIAGQVSPIEPHLPDIATRYEHYSQAGYRVLGLALRDVSNDPIIDKNDEQHMTFIGFLLFADAPKPGMVATLQHLQQMGIQVKMVTGDNRHVARQIGEQVGLKTQTVLTGADLHTLSQDALCAKVNGVDIFAEVEPNQKERILIALKRTGNVVGYMGDGINDVSALHVADVGISVNTAVDVAKEAADIVLLEQDLNVLAQGVRDGRKTFANTLKYIFTTTSANFGNMFSMAGASLYLPFLPLLPKQILLNNFLSDIPSMAIATDDVDTEWLEQPHRWDIRGIRNFMVVFGLVSSVFDYLTFWVLIGVLRVGERQFQTMWFIESLLTELFITLVVRSRRPFGQSKPGRFLTYMVGIITAITLLLPYLPLGALFGLSPLPVEYIVVLVGITVLYLIASEVSKHFFYRRHALRRTPLVAQ